LFGKTRHEEKLGGERDQLSISKKPDEEEREGGENTAKKNGIMPTGMKEKGEPTITIIEG